jgi:hypothetical protein
MEKTLLLLLLAFSLTGFAQDTLVVSKSTIATTKPLSGKSVSVLGDSFVQQGLVQGYINSLTGAAVTYADGVGGSCIAGNTNYAEGDGVNRVPLSDDSRLNNWLNSSANVKVIFGGLNDTYYQTPLGTINSTDPNTFGGALNKILTAYLAKATTTPIRLVAFTATVRAGSNKAGTVYTDANLDSLQGKYINLEIQIFQKYHLPINVPYYDLGIGLHNYQQYTTVDPVHLNSTEGRLAFGTYCAYRTVSNSPYIYNIGTTTPPTVITGNVTNQPIDWSQHLAGDATYSPYTLTLNTVNGGWVHGASASVKITSGDCSLDVPSQTGADWIVGLSTTNLTNQDNNYSVINYGAYLSGSFFRVFENGNNISSVQTAITGAHAISVKIVSGQVKYYLDGNLMYTSTTAPVYPLIPVVAMSLNSPNVADQISNATITGAVVSN